MSKKRSFFIEWPEGRAARHSAMSCRSPGAWVSDLVMTATCCEIAATPIVSCRADAVVPSVRLFLVLVAVCSRATALGSWRCSDSLCAETIRAPLLFWLRILP